MRQLALHHFVKARVWLDEMPDAFYPRARSIERALAAFSAETLPRSRAAVEIFVPLGGKFMYALLGCEFEQLFGGSVINVNVAVSGRKGARFDAVTPIAEAQVGLPEEYTAAIFESITDVQTGAAMFPSGRLTFACAAHSPVGSSLLAFRRATEVLSKLIRLPQPDPSDEELIALFPTGFSKGSSSSSSTDVKQK